MNCKPGDIVEVLHSECGNTGQRGRIEKAAMFLGVHKWQVGGAFHGYDGSFHSHGYFMDMDLRPIHGPETELAAKPETAEA